MPNINWFEFAFEVFNRFVDLISGLYSFLFTEIVIPSLNVTIFGIQIINLSFPTFSLWLLLGGVGIATILTAKLIKTVVPGL